MDPKERRQKELLLEKKRREKLGKTVPVIAETQAALHNTPVDTTPRDSTSTLLERAGDWIAERPQALAEGTRDALIAAPQGAIPVLSKMVPGYQEVLDEARRESPVGSMVGEAGGAALRNRIIARSPLGPKIPDSLQEGRIPRSMVEGAAIAAGETDADSALEKGLHIGGGAALSGATHYLGRKFKALFDMPEEQLAKAYGAKTRDFKFAGRSSDPTKVITNLESRGLLNAKQKALDLQDLKWKPVKGKVVGRKDVSKTILEQARAANEQLTAEVEKTLAAVPGKYDMTDIGLIVKGKMDKALKSSARPTQLEGQWIDALKELQAHFSEAGINGRTPRPLSLVELNQIKNAFQREAVNVYKSPDPVIKGSGKVYADIASSIEELIHQKSGDSGVRIRALNDLAHDLHLFRERLGGAIASGAGRAGDAALPGANIARGMLGMDRPTPGPEELMNRSWLSRVGKSIPLRPQLEDTAVQFPVRDAARAMGNTDSMVTPYVMEGALNFMDPPDRAPQSLPEQLVRKPFPRTSKGMVENRDFVLAKVAQQAPEMFDSIRDVIDFEPEKIPEVMPALMTAAPHLFSFDKFNRWDGKIFDPKAKELARKEIMGDDNMSNTEKALLMNRLNKTGEY